MEKASKHETDGIDVNLEITSNWGDPSRVGLTEVC